MFGRVTWIDNLPSSWDSTAGEQMAQELRSQPGWLATVLGLDRQTGNALSVGYWESAEALKASEPGNQARAQRIESTGARIREIERYELVLVERTGPPQANTFIRLNDVRGTPAKLEEMIAFVRDRVAPLLRGQKGFRAMLMGVNRDNGRSLVSSVWDSAANREASDAALTELRREGARIAGAEQAKAELFEVVSVLEKSPGSLAGNR